MNVRTQFLIFTLALAIGCKNQSNSEEKEVSRQQKKDTISVETEFSIDRKAEQDPPQIDELFVQKLKEPDAAGNNTLLAIRYSKESADLISSGIKIRVGEDEVLTFDDNGTNGDNKKGDGLFTTPVKLEGDVLIKFAKENNEQIKKMRSTEVVFEGRSAVSKKLIAFDIEKFNRGELVPFTPTFISSITAANIANIREKSLMIRNVSVVEDLTRTYDPCRLPKGNANGVWAFGTLINNMTGGFISSKDFLVDWVDNQLFSQQILASSTDASNLRNTSKARVIRAWIKNSGLPVPGGLGIPAGWKTLALKPHEFPVRLLAIVNRLDLRGNSGYGGGVNNAGEGRFVFCFVDSNNNCSSGGNNGPGTMTFILEYGVPIKKCSALKNYAKQWWDLQNEAFGPAYNQKLQNITNVFTAMGANPAKANKSALNHLRTNDFIQSPWDIRDFEIDATSHKLKMIHPAKEPMRLANGSTGGNPAKVAALVNFVNGLPMTTSNPSPPYNIPDDLKGIHAPMPTPGYHWSGNTANVMAAFKRREFSFNTCSSCHTRETGNIFTHVKPRNAGVQAAFSPFMMGNGAMGFHTVIDPGPIPRMPDPKQFNEALRRAKDLEILVFVTSCTLRPGFPGDLLAIKETLMFQPLNMTH